LIKLREAKAKDAEKISALLVAAFEGKQEADLVKDLRENHMASLEWVAEQDGALVGHILYSPVWIEKDGLAAGLGVGLAPMCVDPASQKKGIGTKLINETIARLKEEGIAFAVVLGDPAYYRRFGFRPASEFGLRCEFDAPEGAFQALPIETAGVPGGTAKYCAEFDRFKCEWQGSSE
jgi:putative acetyltransferase